MKTPDIAILDINGLGYAAMYVGAFAKMEVDGFPTGAIHGAMMSVFANMGRSPSTLPVVIWDRKATWRHECLPEYKANRGDTEEKLRIRAAYRRQVPVIQLLLSALGIPQISCGEAEADDLAGAICRNIHPSWIVELDSKDTDWYQAIAHNVTWYSPLTKQFVTPAVLADPNNGLSDGHFLTPQEYLQAKHLAGDSSDCIPGVGKVGLSTAVKYMREHGGAIQHYWDAVDEGRHSPKGVVALRLASAESRAVYARNKLLMDWSMAPPLRTDLLTLTAGKADWAQFEDLTDEYNLAKVRGQAKQAMKPWSTGNWGAGLWAVDAALNADICQQLPRAHPVPVGLDAEDPLSECA